MNTYNTISFDTFKKLALDYSEENGYICYKGKRLHIRYEFRHILQHILFNTYGHDTEFTGMMGIELERGYDASMDDDLGNNSDYISALLLYICNGTRCGWYITDKEENEGKLNEFDDIESVYTFTPKEDCSINSYNWEISVSNIFYILSYSDCETIFNSLDKDNIDYAHLASEIVERVETYRNQFKTRFSRYKTEIDNLCKITTLYIDYMLNDYNLNIFNLKTELDKYYNESSIFILYENENYDYYSQTEYHTNIKNIYDVHPHSWVLFNLKSTNNDEKDKAIQLFNYLKELLITHHIQCLNYKYLLMVYKKIIEIYIDNKNDVLEIPERYTEDGKISLYNGDGIDKYRTLIYYNKVYHDFCDTLRKECASSAKYSLDVQIDLQIDITIILALINLTYPNSVISVNKQVGYLIANNMLRIINTEYIPNTYYLDNVIKNINTSLYNNRLVLSVMGDGKTCFAVTKGLGTDDNLNSYDSNSLTQKVAKLFPNIKYMSFKNFIQHIVITDVNLSKLGGSSYEKSKQNPGAKVGLLDPSVKQSFFNIDAIPNYNFDFHSICSGEDSETGLDSTSISKLDFFINSDTFKIIDPVDLLLEGYGLIYNHYLDIISITYDNFEETLKPYILEAKIESALPTVSNVQSYLYYVLLLCTQIFSNYTRLYFLNDLITFEYEGEKYIGVLDSKKEVSVMPIELGSFGIDYDIIKNLKFIEPKVLNNLLVIDDNGKRIVNPLLQKTINRINKTMCNNYKGDKRNSPKVHFQHYTNNSGESLALWDERIADYALAYLSRGQINPDLSWSYFIENEDLKDKPIEEILNNPLLYEFIRYNMSCKRNINSILHKVPRVFNKDCQTIFSLRNLDITLSNLTCFGQLSRKSGCFTTNLFKKRMIFNV